MSRLAWLPLLLAALAACDDFHGDLDRLAFTTNLHVGLQPWTPARGVAAGSAVTVMPGHIVGRETQPEHPVVQGFVKGGVATLAAEPCADCVQFVGAAGARARVGFTVDDVYDEFRVRFEPAAGFTLDRGEGPIDELAVVAGRDLPFALSLVDARGRPLGYDADQIEVTDSGPLSAWQDEGVALVLSADGDPGEQGTVALSYAGRPLGEKVVTVVSADEVVRTEKICPPQPQACDAFMLASYTADGTRVFGAIDTWEGRRVGAWGDVAAR